MRILTPWSEKDLDKKVDSDMPGKFFGEKTSKTPDVTDFTWITSSLMISKRLKRSRYLPSNLMDKSPNTKKPPSVN